MINGDFLRKQNSLTVVYPLWGEVVDISRYGNGHINDTYRVTVDQAGASVHYLLQRINTRVFREPALMMENIRRVTEHQRAHYLRSLTPDLSRRFLTIVPTREGKAYHRDEEDSWWRLYLFIEGASTHDVVRTPRQAYEAARAFGVFQRMMADLPGPRLHETIPDFHNTPKRFQALVETIEADPLQRRASASAEIDFVLQRQAEVGRLLELFKLGSIPERITHNDTKLNNVMLDDETSNGVCVIDLDTVMPGLALFDFGDLVRGSTSPAPEDERELSKVTMQMPMFEALVEGYLNGTEDLLTETELEELPFSGKLITLEIGIRFLTDYLKGDVYFKVHRDGHNLDRCRTQFRLVASIEEQYSAMRKAVGRLRRLPSRQAETGRQ